MNNHVGRIWAIADLLRGDYKQSEYGRVILPLVLLRRLDCVLEPTKAQVLERAQTLDSGNVREAALKATTGVEAYNTSPLTLRSILADPDQVAGNLRAWIAAFDTNTRNLIEKFHFDAQIARLERAKLLYLVLSKMTEVDLRPDKVSDIQMGYLYEELVRKSSELSDAPARLSTLSVEAGGTRPTASWLAPGEGPHFEGAWQSSGYRSSDWRALCAKCLFVAVAVLLVWQFALAAQGNQFARKLAEGGYVSQAGLAAWANDTDTAGNLFVWVAMGLAVAFIAWLARTVDNVPALGGGTPHESPRWAVVWWFVPIAFLWKPYSVVRESWDRLATPAHNGHNRWVVAWWICWIGGVAITRLANAMSADPSASYAALETAYADEMLGLAALIVSAVLGFLVIRETEDRARDRAIALGLEQPRLPQASDSAQPKPTGGGAGVRYCTRCGEMAVEGDAFCANCGGAIRRRPSR
jgi:hypothetical protein